jgi:biotin carboxylase
MKPTITVCVTCVGGRLIFDIVTALRAATDFEVFLLGIDADPSAAGRLLCDRFEVLPMAEQDEEGYLQRLLALHREIGIDVYIPLSEPESMLAARHRELLREHGIRPSVGSADTVRVMTDKLLMHQRLEDRGIDAGSFVAVDTAEQARRALETLGYPDRRVVLKPRSGRGSRGVLIADASQNIFRRLLPERFCGSGDFEALRDAMAEQEMTFENLLAVPYRDGPVFDVDCIAENGRLTDISARLRQLKNPLWPTSTGHRIAMDPRVLDYARQLCTAFGVDGAGDFDIVLSEGTRPLLFDAAARFSGSVGGSFTAGANFPAQLVRLLMELPRQPLAVEDGVVLRPYVTMARIPPINQDDFL